MKKYVTFELIANNGEVHEFSENYKEIFAKYQRQDSPKTLYGTSWDGHVSVIFSKG